MSKDEMTKQLEELKKYVEEQKRREAAAAYQQSQAADESLLPENTAGADNADFYDEDAAEEFEAEDAEPATPVYEPEAVSAQRTSEGVSSGTDAAGQKKGCGCGCFSFIVFIIILSMLVPVVFYVLRDKGLINYSKTIVKNYSSGGKTAALPAVSADKDDVSSAFSEDDRYYSADDIIRAIAYITDENAVNEIFALAEQRENFTKILAQIESDKNKYETMLPQEAVEKAFASPEEMYDYFYDLYNKMAMKKIQYSDKEAEAVAFYLNYGAVEKSYAETNRKLNAYMDKFYAGQK